MKTNLEVLIENKTWDINLKKNIITSDIKIAEKMGYKIEYIYLNRQLEIYEELLKWIKILEGQIPKNKGR